MQGSRLRSAAHARLLTHSLPPPPSLPPTPRRWLSLKLGPEGSQLRWEEAEQQARVPELPWFLAAEEPAGLSAEQRLLWGKRHALLPPKRR